MARARSAGILGPAEQTGLAGHVFAQRADIGRDHGQTEAECQERHAALKDIDVRDDDGIGGLEVGLDLVIRNEPHRLAHQLADAELRDRCAGHCLQ